MDARRRRICGKRLYLPRVPIFVKRRGGEVSFVAPFYYLTLFFLLIFFPREVISALAIKLI